MFFDCCFSSIHFKSFLLLQGLLLYKFYLKSLIFPNSNLPVSSLVAILLKHFVIFLLFKDQYVIIRFKLTKRKLFLDILVLASTNIGTKTETAAKHVYKEVENYLLF